MPLIHDDCEPPVVGRIRCRPLTGKQFCLPERADVAPSSLTPTSAMKISIETRGREFHLPSLGKADGDALSEIAIQFPFAAACVRPEAVEEMSPPRF